MVTVKLRSWRHKNKQLLIIVGIVIIVLLIVFALEAYRFGWNWTGFNEYNKVTIATDFSSSPPKITRTVEYQPGKTLWDWLNLLGVLAIPAVVGLGAAWYTAQQGKVSERENTDNQHEAALQTYIDKMSELLLKEHLGERTADGKLKPEYEEVRKIARVRTLTVLQGLDGERKGSVLQFLYESSLIDADKPIVELSGANLSEANLSDRANLSGANLYYANLSGASLSGVFLDGANLGGANLRGASLYYTNLSRANLTQADLNGASLSKANLSKANLRGASITEEQLKEILSLNGTTLPDGSKLP